MGRLGSVQRGQRQLGWKEQPVLLLQVQQPNSNQSYNIKIKVSTHLGRRSRLRGFSGGGRSWGTGGINVAEFCADGNGFSLRCVVLCDDTIILGKDVNSDLIGLDLCDDFIGFYCLTDA